MRLKRNAAWRQRRPAALVAAQVADLAEPPLVKPELPKAPEQPDLRGVKSEVLKAQHEKKYEAERKKWLERKKHPGVQGGAAAARSSSEAAGARTGPPAAAAFAGPARPASQARRGAGAAA